MGAYLSEPVTTKHSSEESSDTLVVGASSMQGWRVNQEDAHNTILDFDKAIQMFAVYDGHGGAEVAQYCSQMLPEFIRKSEAYAKGDLEEALKQAFLDLDASLTEKEVILKLKRLRSPHGSDDEEENVANLREEARMPIEAVIAKYRYDPAYRNLQSAGNVSGNPLLPAYIRHARALVSGEGGSNSVDCEESGPSSSGMAAGSAAGSSSTVSPSEEEKTSKPAADSSSGDAKGETKEVKEEIKDEVKKETKEKTKDEVEEKNKEKTKDEVEEKNKEKTKGEVKEENKEKTKGEVKEEIQEKTKGEVKEEIKEETKGEVKEIKAETKQTEDSIETETKSNGPSSEETSSKTQVNGDIGHPVEEPTDSNDGVSSTIEPTPLKNGKLEETEEVKPKGKGKAKDKSRSISEDNEEEGGEKKAKSPSTRTRTRQLTGARVMQFLASQMEYSESDDSEDEDDTSFEGKVESSDDDDDDDDDDDEEEDETDETDSEDEDMHDDMHNMGENNDEPGSGSGCTAVVALLKGRDLYVANAGDSRCVVCRDGKAVDMSLDHKPEDSLELQRILAAGGNVRGDGRVNGGLNLSRAIGDHGYKQSKNLPATEQMITALPDVRTLRIDPAQDEFMVLACDGIWNFMSSQQVVDFVRERLVEKKLKPAKICEELFTHCLSPNTFGDGTGCDNMTAVIVQFQPALAKEDSTLERETILESPFTNEAPKKADTEYSKMGYDEECDEDVEERENEEETEEEGETEEEEKTEDGCWVKKRTLCFGFNSPKSKKLKADSEANEANEENEANGVQV